MLKYKQSFAILRKKEGTSVRIQLLRSVECGGILEMMYLAKDGSVSQRRIKVLQVEGELFRAYCFLRKAKRKFLINNVLALDPVIKRERDVV